MNHSVTRKLVPAILVAVGTVVLVLWITGSSSLDFDLRVPGHDNVYTTAADGQILPQLKGTLTRFEGEPTDLPGAWPRFRGQGFDGISTEQVPLARKWSEGGPRELWAIDVGEGYAGAAILAGRVYVLDYDREHQADALRCLSLADGREIWRFAYPVKIKRNHGMSRTVPAVTEKYVVALGPKCHVTCLDAVSGKMLWALDLVDQFETEVPLWYAGQCPLIDRGRAIIAPGGKALMIAVDCRTGEIIWQTPNPHRWQMTHSSIVPMEFNGRRMYVYCASGGVVGISAEDGEVLWETTAWKIRTNIPAPVVVGDGRIFLSGGYGAGSMMLQIKDEGGKLKAEPLYRLKPEVFGADQQTPIVYKGYIYGVRPDEQLVCLDPDGKLIWTSGAAHKFGLGPFIIADDLILIMNDTGLLTLAVATPAGYKQLDGAQVLAGHDSWGPLALAGGRLIARDLTRMVCLDVRAADELRE